MSGIIQLLPDHVANQIAAGEVVQRPASVVKELLENSIDAKSTEIKLVVKDAGKTLIQVIDNGTGMNITDARLCFDRHATSKIRHAEDLFSLDTKGFRGEALASIAAIAHVEMKTKQDQTELGTHIVIEGSKIISQEVAVLPKGTSFIVKNLFFNIPARRNFLKSDTIEMRHIIEEFHRVALAHPKIIFKFYNNTNEVFNLPSSNLRQRIVNIFSGKTNEKLVPINEETEIASVEGFVGKPEFSKKNRSEQYFFVNNRFIKSPYLHHAIISAYEGILKEGLQPVYYLYISVPPHTIDINIHPTKTEIKFENEQLLYAILRSSIKHSLGQFNIAPAFDFDRDANLDIPYHYKDKVAKNPTIEVDRNFNPFLEQSSKKHTSEVKFFEQMYQTSKKDADVLSLKSNFVVEPENITNSLFEEQQREYKTFQIHKKYIISTIKSGVLIINQQRAHQRILYEQFLTHITLHNAPSQQLLFPLNLNFLPEEIMLISEIETTLNILGFIFEINSDYISVSGIPVGVAESDVQAVLCQLLDDLKTEVPGVGLNQNDFIAKSMSKSLSIKTGGYLTENEQENIVNSLFSCKEPGFSPFQKSTFITIRLDELDKKFIL